MNTIVGVIAYRLLARQPQPPDERPSPMPPEVPIRPERIAEPDEPEMPELPEPESEPAPDEAPEPEERRARHGFVRH